MILINLLPHREEARQRARSAYNFMLILAAIVGLLIAMLIYSGYTVAIDSQLSRNSFLSSENKRLDGEIKNVANLQTEIAALKARQQAVESLQTNRNLPVHLLNDTVRLLPEGLFLTAIKQDNDNIQFVGVAQSQERVSELLHNLALQTNEWLRKPELVEITAGVLAVTPHDQRRVYHFTLRALLTGAAPPAPTPKAGNAPPPPKGKA